MDRVGIVIVTCNSEAVIGECLDAALRTGADVVVVDNASADGTGEVVARRGARLIANAENRGFAAGVNQGISALETSLILLLNPDAVLVSGLDELAKWCSRPEAAGAGGCLIGSDGRAQVGFMVRRFPTPPALICEALLINRLWPRNRVNWHYRCLDLDYAMPMAVEQPAGAFLMIRRDVWSQLGGFDEGYHPVWFEDVDFCRRAALAGYTLYYVPEGVAKHTGGHSILKVGLEIRPFYWYRSLLRYSARHFRPGTVRVIALAVIAGAMLRWGAGVLPRRGRQSNTGYRRVIRLARRYLWSGGRVAG
jgi:hypothetical protein